MGIICELLGVNQGITIQMIPFSEYVEDLIKCNDEEEMEKIFDLVEWLLQNDDESVQTAKATSFLEYLLSKDPDEIKFKRFIKYLGKETINYCKAWDKFTVVKTEGVSD